MVMCSAASRHVCLAEMQAVTIVDISALSLPSDITRAQWLALVGGGDDSTWPSKVSGRLHGPLLVYRLGQGGLGFGGDARTGHSVAYCNAPGLQYRAVSSLHSYGPAKFRPAVSNATRSAPCAPTTQARRGHEAQQPASQATPKCSRLGRLSVHVVLD